MNGFGRKIKVSNLNEEQMQIIKDSCKELEDLEELILKKDIENIEDRELAAYRLKKRDKIKAYNKLLELTNEEIIGFLEIVLPLESIYSYEYFNSYKYIEESICRNYKISEEEELKQKIRHITRMADNPTHEIQSIELEKYKHEEIFS